ncbi:hypothetical protein [Pseudoneobacillus sp. C159]
MITLAYFLVFSMLSLVIAVIDMYFLNQPVEVFFQAVITSQFITRKWWVFSGATFGLIYSLVSDYKRYKGKRNSREEVSENHQ